MSREIYVFAAHNLVVGEQVKVRGGIAWAFWGDQSRTAGPIDGIALHSAMKGEIVKLGIFDGTMVEEDPAAALLALARECQDA